MKLKCKFIFYDWIKDGKSVYQTEKGITLSDGDLHSGSTFNGVIALWDRDTKEIPGSDGRILLVDSEMLNVSN